MTTSQQLTHTNDPDDRTQHVLELRRTYRALRDGRWRTIVEVCLMTGDCKSVVLARLRDLDRFCGQRVGIRRENGLLGKYQYRLEPKASPAKTIRPDSESAS